MYELEDLMGFSAKIPLHKANMCYYLDCFYDKMGSAKLDLQSDWLTGFYTDANCRGEKEWLRVSDYENATNIYAVDDGIDNTVSSMIAAKFSADAVTYTNGCTEDMVATGSFRPT